MITFQTTSKVKSMKKALVRCKKVITDQQKELESYLNQEIELINAIEKEKWSFDTRGSPLKALPIIKVILDKI